MSRKLLTLLRRGGKSWIEKNALLYDTFKTAASAPLTSPRTAEPGPGLLTIVDTENKFSIVDGDLVCAGGKAAPGFVDPAIWIGRDNAGSVVSYPATAGDVSFHIITPSSLTQIMNVGFDTGTPGGTEDGFSFRSSGSLEINYGTRIPVGSFAAGVETKLIVARRSDTGGHHFIQDGKLLWTSETGTNIGRYPGIVSYSAAFTAAEMALLPLATYNSAWGGDWTEVTDTETNPASSTTFSCEADFHARWSWTHEVGKTAAQRFRYTDANNTIGVQDFNNTFSLFKYTGGDFTSLWSGAAMTDGVSYTADLVAEGSSLKLYLNGVLKATVTETDHQTVTGGIVIHNLATNDIVLTTHPYPALGIATSRVVCPQDNDAFDHEADCVVELKNVTLSSSLSPNIRFRYTSDTNSVPLAIVSDGSIILSNNASTWNALITGGAGTVSDGDDIVLVLDGVNAEVFVAGTSVGTTSSLAIVGVSGGVCSELVNGITFDHIACFPRDVSDLLPKGTF